MDAKQKTIKRLQRECTPIKDENGFDYYAINNVVWVMEIAIKEAKKEEAQEIFDELYPVILGKQLDYQNYIKKLKERHLSTL
jgi:hypothetical protein